MSFRQKRVLLSTPFYALFEFFLLKYIFLLIGGVNDIYIISLAVIIGLMRIVPMFLESSASTPFGRFLSTLDGLWMWGSLMYLIDIVFIYLINIFIPLSLEIRLLLLAIVPVVGVYNYYNAHKIVIKERTIKLPNLSQDMNIIHLSDVHFGSVRHKSIIKDIVDRIKEIEDKCDLVVISGDLADGSSVILKDDFLQFAKLDIPIFFTPGNHDFYMGIGSVVDASRKAGIIVLDNEKIQFKSLNIYGLTYSFEDKSTPKFDKDMIDPNLVNILNYHVPYYWDEFSSLGFDIQLSGHTHGGQFYPVVWFSELLFKYNKGLFKNKSGKYLHVTTGVGSMDVPMRWGTNSEIVILKLRK